MEVVHYEVSYCEPVDDYKEETDSGWAFGKDLGDITNQIAGYYGADNINTIKLIRIMDGERDHLVLSDWEVDDFLNSDNVTNS